MPPFDLCTGPLGSIECWQKIGAVTQNSVFNIKFNILTQNSAPQQGQNFDGGGYLAPSGQFAQLMETTISLSHWPSPTKYLTKKVDGLAA